MSLDFSLMSLCLRCAAIGSCTPRHPNFKKMCFWKCMGGVIQVLVMSFRQVSNVRFWLQCNSPISSETKLWTTVSSTAPWSKTFDEDVFANLSRCDSTSSLTEISATGHCCFIESKLALFQLFTKLGLQTLAKMGYLHNPSSLNNMSEMCQYGTHAPAAVTRPCLSHFAIPDWYTLTIESDFFLSVSSCINDSITLAGHWKEMWLFLWHHCSNTVHTCWRGLGVLNGGN